MNDAFGHKYPRKELRVALTEFTGREVANEAQSKTTLTTNRKEELWLIEFGACLVSLAAFLAVVGILSVHDGHVMPTSIIPDWHPIILHQTLSVRVNLTLNSVIAIFSTIFKSSLAVPIVAGMNQLKWTWFSEVHPLSDFQLIDQAKEGISGPLMLIWATRGRRIVCLGALVTVATLYLDFSFQTLVNYPLQVKRIADAEVPQAFGYSSYSIGKADGDLTVDGTMLTAIHTGTFNVDGSLDVAPACMTGQCTWSDYASLGICSQCNDATQKLRRSCARFYIPDIGESKRQEVSYCNYTLSNGIELTDGGDSFHKRTGYNSSSSLSISGVNFPGVNKSPISSLTTIRGERSSGMRLNVNATQCTLSFCVKKFRGFVQNGVFIEREVDNYQIGVQANTGLLFVPPVSFWTTPEGKSATFIVSNTSVRAVQNELSKWWSGDWSSGQGSGNAQNGNNDVANRIYGLGGFAGIESMITNISTTMTNAIRTTGDVHRVNPAYPAHASAIGQALQVTPVIKVRWSWLIFPGSLLVITFVFLMISSRISSQSRGTLWKNSSLAPFVHPLNSNARKELKSATTVQELDKLAQMLEVRWAETEKGWRLIRPHRSNENDEADYGHNVRHRERLQE